jgi:hypothetical protein
MEPTLLDEIETFLRAVRLRPHRPSVSFAMDDDDLPWCRCLDCNTIWMPTLNRGCRQVRGRIHECWPSAAVPRP